MMTSTENVDAQRESEETPGEGMEVVPTSEPSKNKLTDAEIDDLVKREEEEQKTRQELMETKKGLGIDPYETTDEVKGNYSDDWTLLLQERMKHPISKGKFIAAKIGIFNSDACYEKQNILDKEEQTKKYHYDQIRDYDENIDAAFSYTTYVSAREAGNKKEELGNSRENGTVFIDALHKGRSLTAEEENLVEAHEKGHVLRDFKINAEDIGKGFDFSKIPEEAKRPSYLRNPDELAERMAQLKNYFGFKGDEVFTRQHLSYARENYLKDGKLDNNMSDFFSLITPEKEDEFLRIINTYPL
jgi:hypothetical protein